MQSWDVFKMSQTADVSLLAYDRAWMYCSFWVDSDSSQNHPRSWCRGFSRVNPYLRLLFLFIYFFLWCLIVTLLPGVTLTLIHVSSSSHPDVLSVISALSIYQHQPRWVRLHCCLSELQCLLPGMWTGPLVWHQLLTSLPSPWLWPVRL